MAALLEVEGDHGVARQDMGLVGVHGFGLFAGHPAGIVSREFALARRLVYVCGGDLIGNDTQARKEFAAARACGGQDQAVCDRAIPVPEAVSTGRGHRVRA